GDDRTVDTHIKMLRHNLGPYRDFITTVRGMGYKFEA
ncbi:MAG: winged helix-turn-helix domain-containing protein, partial [Solobacterium sp.]|nr:winged helix-turn-helix domain-containing protein [Solobacterium sp.]